MKHQSVSEHTTKIIMFTTFDYVKFGRIVEFHEIGRGKPHKELLTINMFCPVI